MKTITTLYNYNTIIILYNYNSIILINRPNFGGTLNGEVSRNFLKIDMLSMIRFIPEHKWWTFFGRDWDKALSEGDAVGQALKRIAL
jgi:hypothetical protein